MKLKFALIFSVCALSSGGFLLPGSTAAKVASGEVASSREALLSQLSQQKDKVKTLEAENAKLRETIDALRSLAYGPAGPSSEGDAPGGKKHVIQEGETVSQIASQHGITRETLMEVNGISENQQIYVGDELLIPAAPAALETPQAELVLAEAPPVTPEKTPAPAPAPSPTTAPSPAVSPPSPAPTPETSPAPTPEKITTIAWTEPESEDPPTEVAPTETAPEPKQPAIKTPKPNTETSASSDALATTTPAPKPEIVKTSAPVPASASAPVPVPVPVQKKENQETSTPTLQTAKSPTTETEGTKKGFTYYTIKFGDNLGKIAKKHGISIGALMSFNGIKNPDKISGGQKLKIPSKEKAESLPKVRPSSAPAVASAKGKPQPGDAYGIYTVQTGDTLYDLARDFFTTEKEIQQLNKMGNKTNIVPGQDLIVPMAEYSKRGDLVTSTEGG